MTNIEKALEKKAEINKLTKQQEKIEKEIYRILGTTSKESEEWIFDWIYNDNDLNFCLDHCPEIREKKIDQSQE